jgi:hypothetical protein
LIVPVVDAAILDLLVRPCAEHSARESGAH